jgi:hypothetical protein
MGQVGQWRPEHQLCIITFCLAATFPHACMCCGILSCAHLTSSNSVLLLLLLYTQVKNPAVDMPVGIVGW